MPTDKSTIRWSCDLCCTEWSGSDSHDAAAQCEGTGAPIPLPAGTWVLQSGYSGAHANMDGGIRMEQITGHTVSRSGWAQYSPPKAPEEHLIRYNSSLNGELSSVSLHPHEPGVLNVLSIARNGLHDDRLEVVLEDGMRASELVDLLGAFGIATDADYLGDMAREAYRTFDFGFGDRDWNSPKMMAKYAHLPPLNSFAPEVVRALRAVATTGTDCHGHNERILFDHLHFTGGNTSLARARALTFNPNDLADRAARWWAGELVTIPASALTDTGGTRSTIGNVTISSEQRDAMRDAGFTVPWPARIRNVPEDVINTPAKALQHLLAAIPTTETIMSETTSLFPVSSTIAVASGKGGVGKTTVAAALGQALTAAGKSTLIIDLDFHGPSLGHLLQLPPLTVTENGKIIPTLLDDGTRALSLSQFLTENTPVTWRGAAVEGFLLFLAARLELSGVDTIVFDLPPGTGEVESAVIKYAKPNGAILVTTGSDLSHADCRRAGRFLQNARVPILGVVENLSRRAVTVQSGEELELRIFGEEADTVAFTEGLSFSTSFGKRYAPAYLGSLPFTADPVEMAAAPEFVAVTEAALECAPEKVDPDRVEKRTMTVTLKKGE